MYKIGSHKHLSKYSSYWFIDDHPFRTHWTIYIRQARDVFLWLILIISLGVGKDWIFLGKIIKKLTRTQAIFEVVQLLGNITELYLGKF